MADHSANRGEQNTENGTLFERPIPAVRRNSPEFCRLPRRFCSSTQPLEVWTAYFPE
jgi:hypothetical protein